MAYDVHFYDRRTGSRIVKPIDLDWHGPFWWSPDGNAGCDCNRSLFMYDHDPNEELGCNTKGNVIVIEKIVVDGDVAYSDDVCVEHLFGGGDEEDRKQACLHALNSILGLLQQATMDADGDIGIVLKRLDSLRDLLASDSSAADLLTLFDNALAAARAICQADAGESNRAQSDLDMLDQSVNGFTALVREKTA